MSSDAQKKASRKYDDANTIQFRMKLNKKTDADIIRKLNEEQNKQGYVKQLIRENMKGGS